ncbi:type IV pilin [Halanaeroarchaeum sp. HSR-CO]|uniref:type IV pilin n=1 Tax=Halanaeroarchaeum sp. HSR-CO TaxID=2866382 RepID=UPI0037C1A6FF
MVAITVILAAVIGTFVLGLGENVSTSTPQAQLTLSADAGGNISVEHQGGDAVPSSAIKVSVTNESNDDTWTYTPYSNQTEELTVGDTGVIDTTDDNLEWANSVNGTQSGDTPINLSAGNSYTVQIVHTESDQLIVDRTVRP